jgi:hypothetical protein
MVPGSAFFSPQATGPATGQLTVGTTAALCAAPPAAIDLTATGTAPVASYPTAAIDFTGAAGVQCGGAASGQQRVTVTNNGTAPLTLSGVASMNHHFTIVSSQSPIDPGKSGDIVIQVPAPVLQSSGSYDVSGGTFNDFLVFTTNELGNPTHSVPVNVTVTGANLEFVDGAGAPLAMPIVLTGCKLDTPATFNVKNTGNSPVVVQGSGGYPYVVGEAYFGGAFGNGQLVNGGATAANQDSVGPLYAGSCTIANNPVPFAIQGPPGPAPVPPIVCVTLPGLEVQGAVTKVNGDCAYCT